MSTLDDVVSKPDNLYLFNMLFRHQVYLEGVKAGFASYYRTVLNNLYGEFAKYIGQTRYSTLDGFTRVELQQFIRRFQFAQNYAYNQYTQQLIKLLQDFVAADLEVHSAIYKQVTGKPMPDTITPASLWANIANAIIPANGMTINDTLSNFASTSALKVANRLSMGYANGDTTQDVLASIVGEKEQRHRDGMFNTFNNQNNAIIATILQQVSTQVHSTVASVFFENYQWVAILDSKTTLICRSRNGNVYVYGKGPLPPAHYFCRSKDVPLAEGDELHDLPDNFFEWLVTQPEEVLANMLGQATAAKIVSRSNSVKDISITDSVIPLTLTQFSSKINFITL